LKDGREVDAVTLLRPT